MRLIDGDKLLARYKERCAGCKETKNYCEHCCDIADVIDDIEDAPTADVVERKTGRWEMKPDPYGFFKEIPVCSECGCTTKWREKYRYCPNCGADMRGETNDD